MEAVRHAIRAMKAQLARHSNASCILFDSHNRMSSIMTALYSSQNFSPIIALGSGLCSQQLARKLGPRGQECRSTSLSVVCK